jgi:hypothetical protein
MLLLFPVALLLAAAPAQPAGAGQPSPKMLIWDGGATEEEARAKIRGWESSALPIQEQVNLAAGFPKVLESRTIVGLKPGFWIVVLGVCAAGHEAKPLEALKSLEPKIYVRDVEWSGPLACPMKAETWDWPRTSQVKKKSRELTVLIFERQETYPGGEFEERSWKAVAILRDARAQLLDLVVERSSKDNFAQIKSVTEGQGSILIVDEWASPGCYGAQTTAIFRGTLRLSVDGDKIARSGDDQQIKTIDCGKYYP